MLKTKFLVCSLLVSVAVFMLGCGSTRKRDVDRLPDTPPTLDEISVEEGWQPRPSSQDLWENRNEPLPTLQPPQVSIDGPETITGTELVSPRDEILSRTTGPPVVKIGGVDAKIAEHRGRFLILNMWQIECGPCVAELPHLDEVARAYGPKGIDVVGFNTDIADQHGEVTEFFTKRDYRIELWLKAPGSDVAFRRSIDPDYAADPFTIVFDRQGNRIATIADALDHQEWIDLAEALINDRPIPITDPDIIRLIKHDD